MHVRKADAADAGTIVALLTTLNRETTYLEHEPDEFDVSPDVYARRITASGDRQDWVMFLAERDGAVVGCGWGYRTPPRRTRHVLHVGLGVERAAWGCGAGGSLLAALEGWGSAHGVKRLELFVQEGNSRARRLYERSGFLLEGTKRDARRIDGRYVDEHVMAKMIGRA